MVTTCVPRRRQWSSRAALRYYVISANDPGAPPTGEETVHAATNDSAVAKLVLNALSTDETKPLVSGWDNELLSWVVTPEILAAAQERIAEMLES